MSRTPFVDALASASLAVRQAGLGNHAPLAVFVHPDDVLIIQREIEVARAIVDAAFHPQNPRFSPGTRFLAEVHGVYIYVREEPPS